MADIVNPVSFVWKMRFLTDRALLQGKGQRKVYRLLWSRLHDVIASISNDAIVIICEFFINTVYTLHWTYLDIYVFHFFTIIITHISDFSLCLIIFLNWYLWRGRILKQKILVLKISGIIYTYTFMVNCHRMLLVFTFNLIWINLLLY